MFSRRALLPHHALPKRPRLTLPRGRQKLPDEAHRDFPRAVHFMHRPTACPSLIWAPKPFDQSPWLNVPYRSHNFGHNGVPSRTKRKQIILLLYRTRAIHKRQNEERESSPECASHPCHSTIQKQQPKDPCSSNLSTPRCSCSGLTCPSHFIYARQARVDPPISNRNEPESGLTQFLIRLRIVGKGSWEQISTGISSALQRRFVRHYS